MAAIGSIRKHSTLLLIVIGGALVAFILGDFMKKQNHRDVNIGIIDGEHITIMDYNKKLDQNIENAKQQQQKNTLTTSQTFQIRAATWDQIVSTVLMDKEYEELGIKVTPDELFSLIQGKNPSPIIRQYFTNPQTGQFERERVIQFLQNFNQLPEATKQQWLLIENYIKQDQLRRKFNALLAYGYYIPKELAQMSFANQNTRANITYVAARYSSVPDSVISVTEKDYRKFYDEHRKEFDQKAARQLEYVVFNVLPSKSDISKARKIARETRRDFIKTTRPVQFAKANTDKPWDTAWLKKSQLPSPIAKEMFKGKPGTVSKIIFENNTFQFARLLKKERRPDSMSASHILIAYKGAYKANPMISRTKAQAKKLADSLYKILKRRPYKLKVLAKKYSDDPSVKRNNGNLGWFADGQMIGPFNEAVVNTKVGGIAIAETPFGFHIIKVNGKKDFTTKVKVAMITQDVVPSNATYQNVFAKASELGTNAGNAAGLEKLAHENHYPLREAPGILENTYSIPGLTNPRQIVRWAFKDDTETGKVSNVFDLGDQYVVAVITKKMLPGIPSLDEVKSKIEPYVINKVKGEYLAQKMKAYKGNVNEMAQKMHLTKQEMQNLTFDSRNIIGFGMEDKVIGTVFGMKPKQVSQPVVGNAATFVIALDKITPAGKLTNYKQFVQPLYAAFAQRVAQGYPYVALKEAAEIEDNRIKFY